METAEWKHTKSGINSGYLRKKFDPDGAIQKGHFGLVRVTKHQMIIRKNRD